MSFPFLDFSHVLLSIYYPVTFVTFQPSGAPSLSTSSGTGLGAALQYGLSDEFFIAGGYSLNLSLKNKNVFLSGWDIGTRYYALGGAGGPDVSPGHNGFLSPKYSLYFSLSVAGRNFDISSQISKRSDVIVNTDKTRTFSAEGSYLSGNAGLGVETLLFSPRFRIGAGALFGKSFSSSTALSTTETQFQISLGYQI